MRLDFWACAFFVLSLCGCSSSGIHGDPKETVLSTGHGVNLNPTSQEQKAQAGWSP